MQYNIDSTDYAVELTAVNLDVAVTSGVPLDVTVGESARLDVGEAVNYIKSGQAEIAVEVDNTLNMFNANATEKTSAFNVNVADKITEFNNNASAKTTDFNDNAATKTVEFNSNADDKTTVFNTNVSNKTDEFNDNYADKLSAFDSNASDKTAAFDLNAGNKTTAFDSNYTAKKTLIDAEVANASASATVASNSADLAKQWAIGDPSEPSGNSAKYWANEAATTYNNKANVDLSNLSASGEVKFDAKQDVISDLATIRSGAALGATALQPSALNNYATTSYVDTELETKQDVLTAGTDIEIIKMSDTQTVSGTNMVTFSGAKGLDSVTIFGFCEQNDTPTADNPVNIVCNNGEIIWDSVKEQIITNGTVETLSDSLNNTAVAQMLLSLDSYKDEQDVISGTITRKIKIMVFDGSENWIRSPVGGTTRFNLALNERAARPTGSRGNIISTHFVNIGDSALQTVGGAFTSQGITLFVIPEQTLTTVQDFKNWLAQEYAKGTPVMILYPLEEAITETVTAQRLKVKNGENTIEITQASAENLTLAVTYIQRDSSIINFTNDSGFITSSALASYATTSYVDSGLSGKQATLVSGTNIKTVNNQSLLGSGNIEIQGGGDAYTAGDGIDITSNTISIKSSIINGAELGTTALQVGDNISDLNNDSGYITTSALTGYATENWVNSKGYLTGITSSDVTSALGYTPYNATNPNGYITSSALSGYALDADVVHLTGTQSISGTKTFLVKTNMAPIELYPDDSGSPYIDFHYNNSTSDYTSRIIEQASGDLVVTANNFYIDAYGYARANDVNNSIVTTVNKSKATNGYFQLGNGMIVNWGYVNSWTSNAAQVTFSKAFTTTRQVAIARSAGATTTNDGGDYYVRGISNTGFDIYRTSTNTGGVSWIAIGY